MTLKEELKSSLTPKALIIGTFLVILVNGLIQLVQMRVPGWYSFIAGPSGSPALVSLGIIICFGIALRKWLTPMELTVIYAMIIPNMFIARNIYSYLIAHPQTTILDRAGWAVANTYAPKIWAPPREQLDAVLLGGVPVPWGVWAVPLAYWFMWALSQIIFTSCFALLLRERWLEIESLPFPLAQAASKPLIMSREEKTGVAAWPKKIVYVGILLGFLWASYIGELWNLLWPVIPSPGTQRISVTGYLPSSIGFDLSPIRFTAGSQLIFITDPIAMLIQFLSPMDFLFTWVITYLAFYIIAPPIEIAMGLSGWIPGIGGWIPGHWYVVGGFGGNKGLVQFYTIGIGGVIGFLILTIALSHRELLASLKAAVKGNMEKLTLWAGFIVFFLVYISLGLICGGAAAGMIYIAIFVLALTMVQARSFAEAVPGLDNMGDTGLTAHMVQGNLIMWLGGGPSQIPSTNLYTLIYFHLFPSWYSGWNPMTGAYVLQGVKLGELTNTKWRGVAIATIFASALAAIISMVVFIWGEYTYGVRRGWPSNWDSSFKAWAWMGDSYALYGPGRSLANARPDIGWQEYIFGAAFVIFMGYMRLRFPWFILNPVAFITVPMALFTGYYYVLPMAVALIGRWIVFKVGGSELYNNKFIPFICGAAGGVAIANLAVWLVRIKLMAMV